MRQKAEVFAETAAADVCEPDGFCGRNDVKTPFGTERKGSPVHLHIWQTESESLAQNAHGIIIQAVGKEKRRNWHVDIGIAKCLQDLSR